MSTVAPTSPETITQAEFADMLHVSRGTIYNLRRDKQSNLPKPINTGLKKVLFRRTEAVAYTRYGKLWNVL